jgi:hypothetical protein
MALTERQQRFLDKYLRNHPFKGKGKEKRAANYATLRQTLLLAFKSAPPDLPQLASLLLYMDRCEELANDLKFNTAYESLLLVQEDLEVAILKYQPPTDPTAIQPGDPALHQRLNDQLDDILGGDRINPSAEWTRLSSDPALGSDFKRLLKKAGSLLDGPGTPSKGHLQKAASLIDELGVKREFAARRVTEINKRKEQLLKYATQLDEALNADGFFMFDVGDALNLAQGASTLGAKDATAWTRADETQATSMYLDMMLMLSERDNVGHTNFKETAGKDKTGQDKEIVLAVRRKYKTGDNGAAQPDQSNFKMVVKPMTKEIAVAGFAAGGGASREMMGSVVGDKLQEMLGIDLNVAKTKLVQVDGGKIGLNPGEKVTASVQAFIKQGDTPYDIAVKQLVERTGVLHNDLAKFAVEAEIRDFLNSKVSEAEIQSKAVFDLVALHADRHYKNFLVDPDNKLVPIDHGNILPTREGLRARSAELGPGAAILAQTAAAKKPLSFEMMERIERLDIDALVQTMVDAKQEMDRQTPGADAGNLDEGIQNSKRSAEFLKFAARQLTLEEIYKAYSEQAVNIFFNEEDDKLAGFARAVMAVRPNPKVAADVESRYGPIQGVGKGSKEDKAKFKEEVQKNKAKLRADITALGWLGPTSASDSVFDELFEKHLLRVWDIIDKDLRAAKLKLPVNMPPKPSVKPTISDETWHCFQKLGGFQAASRQGLKPQKNNVRSILIQLELAFVMTGHQP